MAGCYNDDWNKNSRTPSTDVNTLMRQLKKEKTDNRILREELHDQKMSVKSTNEKIKKLRIENNDLVEEISQMKDDRNSSKEIIELRSTVQEYTDIIKRLNNDRKNNSNTDLLMVSLKDKLKNMEQNISALHSEKEFLLINSKLAAELFAKAQAQTFADRNTLLKLSAILSENFFDPAKNRKGQRNMNVTHAAPSAGRSPIVKLEHPTGDSDETSVVLPFFEYIRPASSCVNKMYLLNNCIEKCVRAESAAEKAEYAALITQHFNQAQNAAYLYPQSARFVTSAEKSAAQSSAEGDRACFPDLASHVAVVVETHWPVIFHEFQSRRELMPEMLMLVSREKQKSGRNKYVLFILSQKNSFALRYDPSCEPMNKKYSKTYDVFFEDAKKFETWKIRHLVDDTDGISWIFCIEFARRLAIKIEEKGAEWVINNILSGVPKDRRAFESIDFDLMGK